MESAQGATRGADAGDRIAQLALQTANSTFDAQSILEEVTSSDGVTIDFRFLFINDAAGRLIGREPAETIGRTARELFAAQADWLIALWSAGLRSGEPIVEEIELRPGQPNSPWIRQQIVPLDGAVAITSHDITARKRAERDLWHLAHHDPLTGLPNRTLAETRIDRMVAKQASVVMFIDVDHFKAINDRLGHLAGDEMLSQVAARLRSCTRTDDVVARFGGDEFVICANEPHPEEAGIRLAEKIIDTMRYPFVIRGRHLSLTISIGMAYGRPGRPATELLRCADAAVYSSKQRGRDRWTLFDDALGRELAVRDLDDDALRTALDQHAIDFEAIPFSFLENQLIHSVVLAANWDHPTLGRRRVADYLAGVPDPELVARLDAELQRVDVGRVNQIVSVLPPRARARFVLHGELIDDMAILELERALSDSGLPARRWGIDVPSSVLGASGSTGRAVLSVLASLGVGVTLYGTARSLITNEDLGALGVTALQMDSAGVGRTAVLEDHVAATLAGVSAFATKLELELLVAEVADSLSPLDLQAFGFVAAQSIGLSSVDPETRWGEWR